MSLVQAVICNDFCVVCGEQQANLSNGEILHNFRKVFKLNEKVIIGLTGTIQDCLYLFQDFLTPDFRIRQDVRNVDLQIVYDKVTLRYDEMEHASQKFNTFSLVCGWNGTEFEGRTFFMDPNPVKYAGITPILLETSNSVKLINCGDDRHYSAYFDKKNKYPHSILGVKNTFRDVIDAGVTFDKTIDTNALFEVLRKCDIVGRT